MSTAIDRDLLQKAWPEGYLGMRGVRTVGNWQCVWDAPGSEGDGEDAFSWAGHVTFLPPSRRGVNPINGLASLVRGPPVEPSACWLDAPKSKATERLDAARKAGDLLPNVDPEDVATWACLLKDLAEAAGLKGVFTGYALAAESDQPTGWCVEAYELHGGVEHHPFTLDADNSALALVLARIQLRERE